MSLPTAGTGSKRSTILFLGAVVLAVALWPLVERAVDKLTPGIQPPKAPAAAASPKK